MNKTYYWKLAFINLRKNKTTYVPYLFACIGTVSMFYIMHAISVNMGLNSMARSYQIKGILSFGSYTIAIFSAVFLFYTNSFLIKRRKKELGLYNILGMEKKHIAKIMFFENIYLFILSMLLGIAGGILLSRLMFLVLLKLIKFKVELYFAVSMSSVVNTIILFGIIFGLTLLTNLLQTHLANPIELIKGSRAGEKEPKIKWVMVIIGLLSLGTGYSIALFTKEPFSALLLFFFAVILVMVGTYALFTAGSIALLKLLRKNKKFYYKTKHFTAVSGMIYRMKQNAAGLASICILSTIVLVIFSTTISLYIGQEDSLKNQYPRDVLIEAKAATQKTITNINKQIKRKAEAHDIDISDMLSYQYYSVKAVRKGSRFIANPTSNYSYSTHSLCACYIMSLEDYNRIENENIALSKGEAVVFSIGKDYGEKEISIGGGEFQVKKELKKFRVRNKNSAGVIDILYIIVNNMDTAHEIYKNSTGEKSELPTLWLGFNVNGRENQILSYVKELNKSIVNTKPYTFADCVYSVRQNFYAMTGSFLFLGIFLGSIFLIATILIIYYKQICEGYDDKERFEIMEKIGMNRQEVKKSIHSQILIIFFLPLAMAVIHIAFAFPFISRILLLACLNNTNLYICCTAGVILVFAIVYTIVYKMTAKTYYRIVH